MIIYDPGYAKHVKWDPEIFIPDKRKNKIEYRMAPSGIDPMHKGLIPLKQCLHHRSNV